MTETNASDNPVCMIVTATADEFAAEIARHTEVEIPVRCCRSAEQTRRDYAGEKVVFGNPGMIRDALAHMPDVDWVQSSWAGVTPLMTLSRRDYVLTGIKDVFGPQMSEYVLGYLLAHELKILHRRDEQRRRTWGHDYSGTLEGKRLGIMGTGSIGRHIAKSAANFGVTVTGLSRSGAPAAGFSRVEPISQLHAFLKDCDYLVATLPQTRATDRLLDAKALAALPAHAYFINVGRSNVVDDGALIDALQNGTLAGAALDVFDDEPIPQHNPLWDATNLSITPHVAAVSHPHLIVPIFVDNYLRYMRRKPLRYVIDFDAGY